MLDSETLKGALNRTRIVLCYSAVDPHFCSLTLRLTLTLTLTLALALALTLTPHP